LGRRGAAVTLRLGGDDLHRPFRRLWVLSDGHPPALSRSASVLTQERRGRAVATLYEDSSTLSAIAWPRLGACVLSAERKSCSAAGGRAAYGELAFEGRFAHGLKIKLGKEPLRLRFQRPEAAVLRGAIGFTDHGARHGLAPVKLRIEVAGTTLSEQTLRRRAGLDDRLAVRAAAGAEVVLELRSAAPRRNEVALSLGWSAP
jgi:hypothetical protein